MNDQTYNLDDDREYFSFSIFGNIYNFQYMTTEETDTLRKMFSEGKDDKIVFEYLVKFITPKNNAPSFTDTYKKMKTPHTKKFMAMMRKELSENEG